MKIFFEYIPLIAFLITYKLTDGDIYWATGTLIVASALQMLYYLVRKEKIPTQHLVVFFVVLIFGGLTIFFKNDAFIKWKVTIINGFFAAGLLVSYYGFKKNLIKKFLSDAMTLPEHIWARLNLAWAGFFLFCGGLNLYVAYNFALETWVNFKVFGLTSLTFIFAISSILFVYKYLPQEDDEQASKSE